MNGIPGGRIDEFGTFGCARGQIDPWSDVNSVRGLTSCGRLPNGQLMLWQTEDDLHRDLQVQTEAFVETIDGPMVPKDIVVDGLLDIRNLGRGRDLGLELTVDEMFEEMPPGRRISSEWWMHCLCTFADHAAFLAAGYPPALPELESA